MLYPSDEQSTTDFTIQLPIDLQQKVNQIAARRGDTLSNIVRFALEIYVNMNLPPKEVEPTTQDLERARERMRTFSKGIGSGSPPHDGAENHDAYLYR